MATQFALTAGNSQGPSPTGTPAIGASTSRSTGADDFANGLQALLAADGNSDVAADAPSTSNPNAGAALSGETTSAGNAQLAGRSFQSEVSDVSHLGRKNTSNQPKRLQPAQHQSADLSPTKESQSSIAAATSANSAREKKASQVARIADANLCPATARVDFPTTAPGQPLVVSAALLAAKQPLAHAAARTPYLSTNAIAGNEQPDATAAINVASTALSESAESSSQISVNQIPNALESTTEKHNHDGALPSTVSSASQAETDFGLAAPHLSSVESDVPDSTLQVEAHGPHTGLDSNSNRIGVRRIEAASSSGRSAGSAHPASASSAAGDVASQHASASVAGLAAGMATVPVHGAGQPDRGSGLAANSSSATSSRPDTFAALDSATATPATTWIHAGAHHAEAGYLDPALGWVSVRADGTGDGVHAALVPGSPEAAAALGNHLAGLNAFMAEHQGHTATVTVASPEPGNAHSGTTQQDSSMSGQQNPQQPQDRNQEAPYARGSNPSPKSSESDSALGNITATLGAYPAPDGNGVHLSVMA